MKTAAEMQPQEGDFAMKKGLSIQEKLKDLRVSEKGFTLKQLADETGIASSTLGSYESDDYKDISHTNLVILAEYYHVSTDWLLGLTESREVQNHEIAELHLDNETLDILKSGRLNNRLLCEMIKHPDFLKLMTDTEIYVDGIATMQIKNMNNWLNAVRLQILQQHNPESNDLYVQVLDAARIDEEEYFFHNIHGDLDRVIRSIREKNQNATESAPIERPASNDKKMQRLLQSMKYKSNPIEEFWRYFCEELQIDYDKLLEEEHDTMKRIFKKSKLLKSFPSHRNKARK